MKISLICGAALAILGMAAAPLIAQTQGTTGSTSTGYVQTSKIIGTKVKTAQGEEVGVVKDVVLDRSNGCMAYTVLSAGGGGTRVASQSKLVAVPWSLYTVAPDAGYLTVNVERERIYNAPVFEYSRIGDTAFTNQVYSTFGVSAGTTFYGNNASRSTTTAGTTTNTNSMNNPPPPAEGPGAAAPPNNSPMPAASPSATASATAAPDAKATASPKSGRGHARSSGSPVSPRHKGDETMQGNSGESASDAVEGSSTRKSARKSTDEESSTESGTTSSGKKSSHKKSSKEGTSEASPTPGGEQE